MPRRSNRALNITLAAVLLLVVLLMGVSPLVELSLPVDSSVSRGLEWIRSRVMETMIALWFFALGGMVGSFINVVVWRMPRGVSVVSKGSACPWCTAKIRLVDNVPIFGWIKLGGRCRVCRLPISPRYPIVEAVFASMFLVLFFVEVATAAGNLPGGPWYRSRGILQVILGARWDVLAVYAFHITLVTMLLTWTLMVFDRSRIPVKTIAFALIVGFVGAAAAPWVQPFKWVAGHEEWFGGLQWIRRIDTSFLGLACGFLAGELVEQLLTRRADAEKHYGQGFATSLMTVGLFLGWQAVCTVLLLTGLLTTIRWCTRRCDFLSAVGWMSLATVLQICLWRWIAALTATRGAIPGWVISGICLVTGILLVVLSPAKRVGEEQAQ
ncbi:MAG: prepilin peptidase [Pirellulaceae bacterium]